MFEYSLHFAGLRIGLMTPFEVKIRDESIPFLIENVAEPDVRVLFAPVNLLPPMPENGIWNEDMYYTQVDGCPAVYVRNYPGLPPYAVFQYSSREIRCAYLPDSEIRLNETSSILNLIGLEKILLDNQAFLLHSSFIRYRCRGILFSAPCGTGKSTQADLWEKFRGSDTLNGDRAGVRCIDGAWTAFGMPFAGTSGIYRNESAPLTAIVTLAQGPENVIRRLRPMEAVRKLLPECSCRRWDPAFMNGMLDLLLQLVSQVPVYHLECRPDEGAVNLLHDTLEKDGWL